MPFPRRVTLVALAVFAGCRAADTAPLAAPETVPVETVAVGCEDVEVTIDVVGTLEAEQSIEVKPKRPGHVRELRLIEGASVEAGEVLAVLDDQQLRARVEVARASVADVEVRERNARRRFDRSSALKRSAVTSEQEHDDARAELESATAALGVAHANLAAAEAELAETVIRAPFGGVLGQRLVDAGAFVKEGEALTWLIDLDPMEVVFAVAERYLGEVRLEQRIEARVVSHAERGFPGIVSFIDPRVDPQNRTAALKAKIENPDHALRPGQFASVTLYLARHPGAATIPEEAVVPSGERTLVFVVDQGTATARPIRTGVRFAGRVEVLEGLKAGERVVRIGHEKLRMDASQTVAEQGAEQIPERGA